MIANKLKNERFKWILLLILSSILLSTGGILVKNVDWNPIAIAGTRSFISSFVILMYLKKPKITFNKAQIGGSIGYASSIILYIYANKLTTAANAILLQYTSPIFVAILGAWILKEKLYYYDWITIFLVFGGMTLFFIDNVGLGSMLGNILAVLSGFFVACFTVAFRFQKDGSPVDTVWTGSILAFLIALPFILQSIPDLKSIIYLIVMGVFQIGISSILYALSLKHLTALEAVLITVIEPLLNPVWVFIFVREKPSSYAIVGGAIVLLAIIIRGIYVSKKLENIQTNRNIEL